MTYREVPRSFIYTCDLCSAKYTQQNGENGTLIEQCPDGWIKVRYYQGGVQSWQEILVCATCSARVLEQLEPVM